MIVFAILKPNLRPLLGIENFFFNEFNLALHSWGKIYRDLLSRRNHSIIISGSRSKMKKTMKSCFFSIFDCDPEIIMECLQQQSSVNFTPKKTMIDLFFTKKKIVCPAPPQWSFWRYWDRTWDPFWESKIFSNEFTVVLHFFGVKFTGNYYAVGIIP